MDVRQVNEFWVDILSLGRCKCDLCRTSLSAEPRSARSQLRWKLFVGERQALRFLHSFDSNIEDSLFPSSSRRFSQFSSCWKCNKRQRLWLSARKCCRMASMILGTCRKVRTLVVQAVGESQQSQHQMLVDSWSPDLRTDEDRKFAKELQFATV